MTRPQFLVGTLFFALLTACGPSGELSVEVDAPKDPVDAFAEAVVVLTIENNTNKDLSEISVTIPSDFYSEAGGVDLTEPEADLVSETKEGDVILTWEEDLDNGDSFEVELVMWGASGANEGQLKVCAPELDEMCTEVEAAFEISVYEDPIATDEVVDLSEFDFKVNAPETMTVGQASEMSFSVTNNSEDTELFYSADLGKDFMDTVTFDCTSGVPACVEEPWTYDWNGYTYLTYAYLIDLDAGETLDLSFSVTPNTAGEYTFPFDICMGETGNDCDENLVTVKVSE